MTDLTTRIGQASADQQREMLEEADQWCQARLRGLQERQEPFLESMSLEHPEYRRLLGKHQAYMEMRSYLSGAKKALATAIEKGEHHG